MDRVVSTKSHALPLRVFALTGIVLSFLLAAAGSGVAQDSPPVAIDLPAQPLGQSLVELAEQAGVTIVAPDALVSGKAAPPVSGTLSPEDALRRLLAGSGLSTRVGEGGAIIVTAAPSDQPQSGPARLEPITVEAVLEGTLTDSYAAPDNFASTRTDNAIVDVPQSTQAVTRQALDDAGATEIADAYDYLAGITQENNTGGLTGDDYLARGFQTDNLLVNGNRVGQPTTLDIANVERVEALRGPTAALFGRGDPGGLVNVVTKQPLAEPFYQAELTGGTGLFGDGSRFRDVRATVDTGGPVDEAGRIRYRFNAAAEYERSFRKDIDEKVVFASPVVDFDIDDKTAANVELVYQYREDSFDRGVFFVNDELELDRDFNIAEDQTPTIDKHYVSGTARVDRQLTEALRGRLGLYASFNDFDGEGIQVTRVVGATASAQRRVLDGNDLFLTLQPELVADVTTGSIGHTLLAGLDLSYQTNDIHLPFGRAGAAFDVFDPDFPVDAPAVDLSQPGNSVFDRDLSARSIGVYVQDEIELTEQWRVLAGLRFDAVWLKEDTSFFVNTGGPPFQSQADESFDDTALLPRIGLVYRPVEELSVYASYAETYRPPTAGGLTDINGEQIDPEESQSYEVGIKLDALDGKLTGTLAVFRADKENVLESDSSNFLRQVNLGEVRSQGVEFDLSGEVFENFSLGVSYAYIDAAIRGNDNPNRPSGTRLRNVPKHAASLQAAYRFSEGTFKGLRLFGGIVYEDEKRTNTSATIETELPSYVRFDVGASYDLTDDIRTTFQIRNLTDETYYTSAAGQNNVAVGEPFTALLGVRVRF